MAAPLSASSLAHQKLTVLRKRLDQLGYHETLTIESLPLVEQLFSDLVHTTESLKNAKFQALQIEKERSNFEKYVEPYKEENAKLVKENNQFNQKLIKERENFEDNLKELKSSIRKLDHENADLRFLNSQYVVKLRAMERDSKEKSEMIMTLQEKNAKAVIQTPGGKKYGIPFRRQRMEISNPPLPRGTGSHVPKVWQQVEDVYVADMIRTADSTMQKLLAERNELLVNLERSEESVRELTEKVDVRDMEIERITIMLEGGRPLQSIIKEKEEKEKDKTIEHLNIQLEHLQHQNQVLTTRLFELEGRHSQSGVTRPKTYRESGVQDSARSEVSAEKSRYSRQAESEKEYGDMRKSYDKSKVQQEIKDLKLLLYNKNEEQQNLEKLIKEMQFENEKLTKRITELTTNEKELVMEIKRLNEKSASQRSVSPVRSASPHKTVQSPQKHFRHRTTGPVHMAHLIHLLEAQRDHYKDEVHSLQQVVLNLQNNQEKMASKRPPRIKEKPLSTKESQTNPQTDVVIKLLEEERDFYKTRYQEMVEEENRRNAEESIMVLGQEDNPPSSNVIVAEKEKEIAAVKEELEKIKVEKVELLSKIKELEIQIKMISVLKTESERLKIQKENLEKALDELQGHLETMHIKAETLVKEKEEIFTQYREVIERNFVSTTITNEVSQDKSSDQGVKFLDKMVQTVQTVPSQNGEKKADINENKSKNGLQPAFEERMKMLEESHVTEKTQLYQHIENLQSALVELEKQDGQFQESLVTHKAIISSLEEQVSSLQQQLSQATKDLYNSKAATEQMRMIADQGEQTLEQLRECLNQKDAELSEAISKIEDLQNTVGSLTDTVNYHQSQLATLRTSLVTLEEEKNQLVSIADEKDQQVSKIQQQILSKEENNAHLSLTVTTLESHIDKIQKELRDKEDEIKSLKNQFKSCSLEVNKLAKSQDSLSRENKRLLSDLTTLTRENQSSNQELENVLKQQEELKRQIQEYVTEVTRIQELLAIKEQQRSELLKQYQNLSQENVALETQAHRLESQTSAAQIQVMAKEAELQQCHETIMSLEQEIEEHMSSQEAHRMELTMLNGSMCGLEQDLHQSREEVSHLQTDLESARSLCVQLDSTRNELQRHLVSAEADKEKLTGDIQNLQEEVQSLRSQLTSGRTQVLSLEGLMSSQREKEFRNHLASQELSTEIKLLKDRLDESRDKLEVQSQEIALYKTKASQLDMEVERLKRQVTNEKFERERANQELRKLKHNHQMHMSRSTNESSKIITQLTSSVTSKTSTTKSTVMSGSHKVTSFPTDLNKPSTMTPSSTVDSMLPSLLTHATGVLSQDVTISVASSPCSESHKMSSGPNSPLTSTSGYISRLNQGEISSGSPNQSHDIITTETHRDACVQTKKSSMAAGQSSSSNATDDEPSSSSFHHMGRQTDRSTDR